MEAFRDPIVGGFLIGISALLLMTLLGRITGISGILWGAISSTIDSKNFVNDSLWRWLFVLGLPLGATLAHKVMTIPTPAINDSSLSLLIIAGLLVGFGTRMGSGCTSGHGVCGIGRLSIRSLVATLVFMFAGIATVLIMSLSGVK